MAQPVYEGTPQELASFLAQCSQGRFRLIEVKEDKNPAAAPNEEVLTMLREIAALKATMNPGDGAETDRLLRQAREGAMYGDSSNLVCPR